MCIAAAAAAAVAAVAVVVSFLLLPQPLLLTLLHLTRLLFRTLCGSGLWP